MKIFVDGIEITGSTGVGARVRGDAPHSSTNAGDPVPVAGIAYDNISGIVDVSSGDRSTISLTLKGAGFIAGASVAGDSSSAPTLIVDEADAERPLAVGLMGEGPDDNQDLVRTTGDTLGSGLGALLTSPTGHAYNNVTADEQILAAAGKLHTITIGEVTTAGTLTVYDNTAESGTVIATLELPLVGSTNGLPYTLHFDVNCATGLFLGYDASLVGNVTVSSAI